MHVTYLVQTKPFLFLLKSDKQQHSVPFYFVTHITISAQINQMNIGKFVNHKNARYEAMKVYFLIDAHVFAQSDVTTTDVRKRSKLYFTIEYTIVMNEMEITM